MTDRRLVDALRARAADDAARFRKEFPNDTPNERWLENSYTAALPLAKDDSGIDPGLGPHPELFDAYKAAVTEKL